MKNRLLNYTCFIVVLVALSTSCKTQLKSIIAKGAQPLLVSSEYTFTEGPAVDKDGNVFFTDQPNDQILK